MTSQKRLQREQVSDTQKYKSRHAGYDCGTKVWAIKLFYICCYKTKRVNLFKPIYSRKYQVREKTNVEPLIPMDDQEIISPYSINTIHSKVYMRSFFLLLFSNRHVSDCDRYTEVRYGDKKKNNEKKKIIKMSAHCTSLPEFCGWFFLRLV